ncbi:hypothetical protein AVEN_146707-1 [Araneus ventricosus]|uniref:DUF7041 domain-containing protein n=1 Tax=Araneus ventricosus TaxID=182803 RepID=A0A4Y2W0E5_ARAVE|nr:hypothetical protein AVEN_146707-1 [Araneus ventricosus]
MASAKTGSLTAFHDNCISSYADHALQGYFRKGIESSDFVIQIQTRPKSDPGLWFVMCESTFALATPKAITESVTKYNYIVSHLPPDSGGRSGLVVRSRPRDRRVAGSKPDSTEDPPCMGPVAR